MARAVRALGVAAATAALLFTLDLSAEEASAPTATRGEHTTPAKDDTADDTGADGNSADGNSADRAASSNVEPWYLATGIAVAATGVAMGVLGTWAVLKLDDLDDDPRYRRFAEGVPAALDPCDAAELGVANKDYRLLGGAMLPSEARAHCADRDEFIAIQMVTFPAAVVLSGLGAFLITEAFGEGADDLKLRAEIGPGRFGAGLTASF